MTTPLIICGPSRRELYYSYDGMVELVGTELRASTKPYILNGQKLTVVSATYKLELPPSQSWIGNWVDSVTSHINVNGSYEGSPRDPIRVEVHIEPEKITVQKWNQFGILIYYNPNLDLYSYSSQVVLLSDLILIKNYIIEPQHMELYTSKFYRLLVPYMTKNIKHDLRYQTFSGTCEIKSIEQPLQLCDKLYEFYKEWNDAELIANHIEYKNKIERYRQLKNAQLNLLKGTYNENTYTYTHELDSDEIVVSDLLRALVDVRKSIREFEQVKDVKYMKFDIFCQALFQYKK